MSAVLTPYEPRPGSLADRAIAHLRDLDPGAEITTAMLAAALQSQPLTLRTSLEFARGRGAIFSRQKGGHARSPMFWSLVDHSSAPANAPPVARVASIKEEQSRHEVSAPMTEHQAALPKPPPRQAAIKEPDSAPAVKTGIRLAAWSTGELAIEVEGGEVIVFDKVRAGEVVAFCRRIGVGA